MTDKTSEPNTTHYLMKDRLGSIINILDSNETLKTTYSYDAFGEPTATYHSGQVDCMYRFTGREYDGAMGNYFYRARYYNQSLGRFFSRDPIFSLHSLYAYCATNFTDPFGLQSSSVPGNGGKCEFSICPIVRLLILHSATNGRKCRSVVDGDKSLDIKPSSDPFATESDLIFLCLAIGAFFLAVAGFAGTVTLVAAVGAMMTIFGAVWYFDYFMRKYFGFNPRPYGLWPRVCSRELT